MSFQVHDFLLPYAPNQAVDQSWLAATRHRPLGVTWHWTATWTLAECRRLIGGPDPERQGQASAHFGIGRTFAEGVDRYVRLEDRSWHAGKKQRLRFDGSPFSCPDDKGARTTIGVETVNIGNARRGATAGRDWIAAASPSGMRQMRIQPWTEEQIEMMIAIGKDIQERWPHLRPSDHHGHHDLCPDYKIDVIGFPFARVLRGIYEDPDLPDIWTPFWTLRQRRQALQTLGYDDSSEPAPNWRAAHRASLRRFQRDHGLVENGMWTIFVSRKAYALLAGQGKEGEICIATGHRIQS